MNRKSPTRSLIPDVPSPTRSLSMKLSLSILAMAAPIFVLALGVLFFQSRYFIRQNAMSHANSVLNTTLQCVRTYMCTVETATNSNAWLAEEYFHPDSLMAISRRIVYLNRHVNGCSITAEPDMFPQYGHNFSAYSIRDRRQLGDGTPRVGQNVRPEAYDTVITVREADYDYYSKDWYKIAADSGKACWIDPFNDYNESSLYTSELIASYSRPLYLKDGRFVGIISTDLSMRNLSETMEKNPLPYPNAYFTLVGGDGHYFIHPDSTRLYGKTIFTDIDPNHQSDIVALGHEMTTGKSGLMHVFVDGELCHVCYRPVPGTNWSLALVCPDSDILKSYHRLTYIIAALIFVGLLVILLLCRRVVAHAISPVNRLLDILQQISDGNFDTHIPRSTSEDAIGNLQNSFAKMQQWLNFHVGGILHATEMNKRSNEELVEATKLAEESLRQKTLFIQNVSHQIRTPLNIIKGFAQVLRDSLVSDTDAGNDVAHYSLPDEDVAVITGMMLHNANHLDRMVLMLYDSSDTAITEEKQMTRNDRVSCNEVARESIAYTKENFPDTSVSMQTELADDVCIQTNHVYLMRTLRELLYNSAKYSDGKHISVHVSQTETTVRFTVEDVGPGIAEGLLGIIFKPFIKVDDLSEGLGLGLPLSKHHAQSLGGDLILDTSYSEGCRFILDTPR